PGPGLPGLQGREGREGTRRTGVPPLGQVGEGQELEGGQVRQGVRGGGREERQEPQEQQELEGPRILQHLQGQLVPGPEGQRRRGREVVQSHRHDLVSVDRDEAMSPAGGGALGDRILRGMSALCLLRNCSICGVSGIGLDYMFSGCYGSAHPRLKSLHKI
ncbi:hypothetical protein THAOC_01340, partial [Thalassiosira oceanica]